MAPTTVRAKFTVTSVESHEGYLYDQASGRSSNVVLNNVVLTPVYDADPQSENGRFYAATPGGQLQMFGLRPEIGGLFALGAAFYLDLTRADLPGALPLATSDDGLTSASYKVLAIVPDAQPEHVDAAIQAFDAVALTGAVHEEQKGAAVLAAQEAGATDVQAHAIAAAIPVLTIGTTAATDPAPAATDPAPAATDPAPAASDPAPALDSAPSA